MRCGIFVAILLASWVLVAGAGLSTAPTTSLGPGPAPASAQPLPSLTVNSSYFDEGGSWNCGQGHETLAFFGAAAGGTGPYRYSWDYGDGTPNATSSDPVHTYTSLGPFVAHVTAHDATNRSGDSILNVVWSVPSECVDPSPINWGGVALYGVFLVGAVGFIAAFWRWRRRTPP